MTLLWDWNGTLLDDTAAASGALNAILGRRSLPPVSLEEYRATFSFPARNYYERAGLDLANEDWGALALEYHEAYLSLPKRLARDAEAAVSMARSAGFRQYVLSAMKQELLASETAKYGAGMEFDGIWGTDNLDGGSKLDTARRLAASLPRGERAVVVGDALHDLEAARAIGAKCILYTGGSHLRDRLAGFAPLADSLVEAVETARGLW